MKMSCDYLIIVHIFQQSAPTSPVEAAAVADVKTIA